MLRLILFSQILLVTLLLKISLGIRTNFIEGYKTSKALNPYRPIKVYEMITEKNEIGGTFNLIRHVNLSHGVIFTPYMHTKLNTYILFTHMSII